MLSLENFQKLLNKNNIILDSADASKEQVFNSIASLAHNHGYAQDSKALVKLMQHVDAKASTGYKDGFALPHVRDNNVINKSGLFIVRIKDGIKDWHNFDNKPINFVVTFLLHDLGEHQKANMDLFSKFSKAIINQHFRDCLKQARTSEELINILTEHFFPESSAEDQLDQLSKAYPSSLDEHKKFAIGLTACPLGITNTYMAAEYLERHARKIGYKYKFERHGAKGVDHHLTAEEIEAADFVIIASESKLDLSRFEGKKLIKSSIREAMQHTDHLYEEAEKSSIFHNDKMPHIYKNK